MVDPDDQQSTLSLRPSIKLSSLLFGLHYAYPVFVFLYYIIASSVAACTLQTRSGACQHIRQRLIIVLLFFAVSTFLTQLLALMIHDTITKSGFPSQDTIIGHLSCILVYGVELTGLTGPGKAVWYPYIGSLCIALLLEPAIETLLILTRITRPISIPEVIDIALVASRYLSFIAILVLYFSAPSGNATEVGNEAERQTLLPKEDGQLQDVLTPGMSECGSNGYGSGANDDHEDTESNESPESDWERQNREAKKQMEKRLVEEGNWFAYAKTFMIFVPYMWPVDSKTLQFRAVLVGLCLLIGNFLNLWIPRQLGVIMDTLNGVNNGNAWVQVIIYATLRLINSAAGLDLFREWLWLPVELHSSKALSTAAYSHVLSLSSDFHDQKSSSDIRTAMGSGGSLVRLLESVCFHAFPMLIDMVVACIYLSVTFGPYEGFITVATATLFFFVASRMIEALKETRRKEVSAGFDQHYVLQAGIRGWSTVACFNQIGYEEDRYTATVKKQMDTSLTSSVGYMAAYAAQGLTMLCGLLAGLLMAVYQIKNGRATPGQFVMLLMYWGQLSGPLSFFATLGKDVSSNFIGPEKLLEIMLAKPTVVSKEGAPPLKYKGGQVSLDGVSFSYDKRKEIIKDITLDVPAGSTVAFVGSNGAGKSTVLKLIDRFYDVTKGSIKIDGQDIRDVELSSLRALIGVVPQNPIMFDDTVMNNVRYARLSATDEEIYEACKAACIHDQILGFPNGYKTHVGERGVKLSGGELQRVAIARAILKRPAIVLLDEATSAVDTDTEQKIQEAFRALCKDRTTFIVAHRLSTIINANCIIVIDDGSIVEQGPHEKLICAGGKYAGLWSNQVFLKPQGTVRTSTCGSSTPERDTEGSSSKTLSVVDDLDVEVKDSERAKVQTQKHATPPQSDAAHQSVSTPTRDDREDGECASHVREGSKLNPDAPEFTPRSSIPRLQVIPATGSPTRRINWGSDDYDDQLDGTSTAQHIHFAPVVPIMYVPGVYPVYPELRQPQAEASDDENQGDARFQGLPFASDRVQDGTADADDSTESPCIKDTGGMGPRYPRYSRRLQSKSEPSGSGAASDGF